MSSDYNLSKVLLDFVEGMKKVILDLEALIENHPVCSESFGSYLEENKNPAKQGNTKKDKTEKDNTKNDKTQKDKTEKENTVQDTTELGNDSQADSQTESKGNRKRPCPKE